MNLQKTQPELFSKYLDYCNNKLKIQEKLSDIEMERIKSSQQLHEEQMAFWSSMTSLGVSLTIDAFIKGDK